jgi:hypothetical protein
VQTIGPRGRALAEVRNVLNAKHLTQLSAQLLGKMGRNPAMDTETRAARRQFVCRKSDIFSATKVIAAGFNRVRASTRPRALQARGLRTASPRAVVMPAIPEPRPQREKAIPTCGDCCSRLGGPPSSELFGCPAILRCAMKFRRS